MRPSPLRAALAATATAALVAAGLGSAGPALAAAPVTVHVADPGASAATRSLFSSLDDQRGKGVLFGQQHVLDDGITFDGPGNGTESDVLAGTGEQPAVFGWDTLILEGEEAPGLPTNTPEQNLAAFRAGLQQAHRLGGVSTISAHMRNFVTGEDFTDPTGDVIGHILPGGDRNAEFDAYLDQVAELARTTTDDDGNLIPLIFRPFHENTGSWFWWGAAWASPGEYKEIYRYTVEHLRDDQHVTNLLYAYSPNGSFGGDSARYLATYPGDDFVDVLGYDSYENSDEPESSDAWIATVVEDLAMVADLADARHKVAALTEFGRNGDRTIQPEGNKSLHWFTDLLGAIEADPAARRIAYMMTWANFGDGQIYVPYPAYDDQPANDLFPDFLDFFEDPYTVFSGSLPADLYTRETVAAPLAPDVRLVSPADGQRVTTASTTVRVKTTAATARRVWFTVGDEQAEHPLALDEAGYWSGTWEIGPAALTNRTESVRVHAALAGGRRLSSSAEVILGSPPVLPVGLVDDVEGYGDDAALRAEYTVDNGPATALSLVDGERGHAVRFAYDFTGEGGYIGFGRTFEAQDWSRFDALTAHLVPDGSDQKLVLQLQAGGLTFEAYPSLAGTAAQDLFIPFADFRPPSWDSAHADARITPELLASVTGFNAYVNQVGAPRSGAIVLDDIAASAGGVPVRAPAASTTTVLLSSPLAGGALTATVEVASPTSTSAVPTGEVVLTVDGSTTRTATLDGAGRATFSLASPGPGRHSFVATYAGDEATAASTSAERWVVTRP